MQLSSVASTPPHPGLDTPGKHANCDRCSPECLSAGRDPTIYTPVAYGVGRGGAGRPDHQSPASRPASPARYRAERRTTDGLDATAPSVRAMDVAAGGVARAS